MLLLSYASAWRLTNFTVTDFLHLDVDELQMAETLIYISIED